MSRKLRVSFIEYLNSVPLGWGFLHGPNRNAFELSFDVPSECARRLSTGEADVGLIPVIEYQRIPNLLVLPDIAIASKHEVKSVLFVSRVPLREVSRVAVDSSSRTSVDLLKIILHKFYKRDSISYHEESPDARKMLELYDAALLIGNPALKVHESAYYIYDLAQEWYRFTRLPFVFAFWAVRSGVNLENQEQLFYRSKELGLKQIDSIASLYSKKLEISPKEIRRYILEHLDYSLDDSNLRGLRTFFELAFEQGLIGSVREMEFYRAWTK